MLSFEFVDINDNVVQINDPYTLSINMEENVPCDDMVAVFAHVPCDELKSVRVYDNDTLVFSGIVDEQQRISTDDGAFLKIVARSMAAHLVDNESVPVSYMHPSVSVIENRHTKPFGVRVTGERDTTYFGTQTVKKGDTNWQAVEDFAKNVYMNTPRINQSAELDFSGVQNDTLSFFSNNGDGIRYTTLTENIKRCEEISTVRIKVTNSSGYHSVIENADAISRGIKRERYLNSVLTDTPAIYADSMIKNGRKKSYEITLSCIGQHMSVFGNCAVVKDSVCGEIDRLYVSAVRYRLSAKQEVTTVTLKRKDV